MLFQLSATVATLFLAACGASGEDAATGDAGEPVPSGGAVTAFTIVADDLAWDLDRVEVLTGQEITVTVENREGADHNLHVLSDGDPKTELAAGPVTQTLQFTLDEPGEYDFICDLHPFMKGVIVAS